MTRRVWSPAEVEALVDVAGNYPPELHTWAYNTWASRNGFDGRSRQALLSKLKRMHISVRTVGGDWLSCAYVCQVLGVGNKTPHRWTDRYGIPCHRDGRRARFFRRSDLIQVAQERPATFAGISADRLFLLLEDRQLADRIAAAHPRRGMAPRPVRAVETGWRYPSVRAAATRAHISRQAIQNAIRTGGTAAGYHWTHA